MANIIDYLHWRGDLDFSTSPFNEIDAAIFAVFSYANMSGVVPGWDSADGLCLTAAADRMISRFYPASGKSTSGAEVIPTINANFNNNLEEMLRTLSDCPRYGTVRISRFEENIDFVAGEQFAAVIFTLPGPCPEHVITFRGTDNTLVGWKENFGFAYLEQVPAQDSAQRYLEQAVDQLPGQFIVCGHSKGGNLAVYAGSHISSPNQDRIKCIYNFDGPGFNFSLMDPSPFILCQDKIINYVPEESMIGMMFNSVGKRTVISSESRYAYQHNAFFWNVERTGFIRGNLADTAKLLDCILNSWVSDLSLEERQAFLETVIDLLGDADDTVISKDPLKNLAEIKKILTKYKQMDKETRSLMNLVFESLSTQTKRTLSTTIQQKLPGNKRQVRIEK